MFTFTTGRQHIVIDSIQVVQVGRESQPLKCALEVGLDVGRGVPNAPMPEHIEAAVRYN